MTSRILKRLLSLLVALCFVFCFTTASAATLTGGSTSGSATPITTDLLTKVHTVSIPWSISPVQYWYTVTPPSAGDFYIAVQQTSGYSTVYIQIFQGTGAIDDAQAISTSQTIYPVHAENENDTVVFCIYCSMPSGSQVDFSVCFDNYHNMGTTAKSIKAATCQETGLRAAMCTLCGCFGPEEETPITDHIAGEWVTYTPATCDSDGVKAQLCSMCGEVMSTQAISAGHHFGKWTIEQMPTADQDGIQIRTCTECGTIESKPISNSK